jgi:hypothetical protein
MATVPTVGGPSVALQGIPNGFQAVPKSLGDVGVVQQETVRAAQQVGAYLQREQEVADRVRVDDAINQAKERQISLTFDKDRGFTNLRGVNALQRESGQPLADEYGEQFRTSLSELEAGLGNDRQKRAFQMATNNMLTGFRQQVMAHEGKEFQSYTTSVREGTIANRKREVGLYYNDPARIDEALSSIEASVADLGRNLGGKSAEWIEAQTRKETSNALMVALGAAMEKNDLGYADGFLQKYASRMDADDLLKARAVIDKQMDASLGLSVATNAVRAAAPTVAPSDFDRLANITMQTESGGRRYGADGQLLTSPAGAKGEMQVMDGTNKNPGYGVKPAKDDSPEERARVGRDYLGAMLKLHDGNLAQAWAAYNAGPGAVEKAMDAAMRDARETKTAMQPGAWLKHMPAETQDYVAKNLKAYQSGDGRPTPATLADVHAAVRAQVGPNKPDRLKIALAEATNQWETMNKAITQRDENAVAEAQRWLAGNGGKYSLMPSSLRQAVPPKELDNLIGYGQKIARGEDQTDPTMYQKLSDRDYLRGLSDDQFFTLSTRHLSEADRKHFANERGRLLTGGGTDKPGDLASDAVKNVLDARLRELKIDPSPKDDGGSDSARIGSIRRFVNESVLQAQAAAGKKFNDADIAKHVDGLFAQTNFVDTWGPGGDRQPMLTIKVGDVPRAVRDRLREDFRGLGVDDPTDAQLLGAYFKAREAAELKRKQPR